jgi:nitroimidazol reductase NimA-like FMN-containing flavoprotein (pyridoxamine 5'-phosphate oxidase superfamily)
MTSASDVMKDLLKEGNMCVLCTCAGGKPHCSLMAYITDDTGTMVFMVTLRQTQKYRNFLQNPQASLLVDTRNEQLAAGRGGIRALTVSGTFQAIEDEAERRRILGKMAGSHPHLRELLGLEDAEPFAIKVNAFLLLDGVLEAQYLEVHPGE